MHASSQCGGNAPKRVILTTNTETINAQNQTRKLVEATIGVNAKPVGGAVPNKPVMLLETAEKASVAAKKVRDAQAAAKQSADAINKAPYNPRAFEQHLNNIHGTDNVASSTLPSLSMQNVKLAGKELCLVTKDGRGFKIVFNERGFPIFDAHSVFDTRISPDIISLGKRSVDFKAATGKLKDGILNGSVQSSTFNEAQMLSIMKNSERIPGYTWHHHEDLGRMQLIPSEIHNHNLMRHVGGFSLAH